MADNATPHTGDNSPEQVAFKLLNAIANAEGITFNKNSSGKVATRDGLLTTFMQCLHAVRNPGPAYVQDVLEMGPD